MLTIRDIASAVVDAAGDILGDGLPHEHVDGATVCAACCEGEEGGCIHGDHVGVYGDLLLAIMKEAVERPMPNPTPDAAIALRRYATWKLQ